MPFRPLALRASRRSRDPQMQTTENAVLLASVDLVTVWPAARPAMAGTAGVQPFSAISASLLALREIVFSAHTNYLLNTSARGSRGGAAVSDAVGDADGSKAATGDKQSRM